MKTYLEFEMTYIVAQSKHILLNKHNLESGCKVKGS
jgi:hypothetical protein